MALLLKEALLWSLKIPQIMTLVYLARLVSVTWKQAANIWSFRKSCSHSRTHLDIRTKL